MTQWRQQAFTHGRSNLPVVVVGAGIGGLVAALELVGSGHKVVLLEAADAPGGKMRQVRIGGQVLDAGPTVFTMRWVFDELFDRVGAKLPDHVNLAPVSTLARHAWTSGDRLDLFADVQRSADAIGEFSGVSAAKGYLDFCRKAALIYRTLEQPFLRGSRPGPITLAGRVGMRGLPGLARLSPFTTLWQELGRHFPDPRLRQLFGRYATYCGSSPFLAPATLMLVAHVEQDGVWLVEGGMHRMAQALESLAVERGAQCRYRTPVQELLLDHGRIAGVRLADGETIAAAAVVFNGDVAALSAGLLGASVSSAVATDTSASRSLSALTWNLVATTGGFPLLRHNVFFSDDYEREFRDLSDGASLPQQPTVYMCAQDRGDPHWPAPSGPERMLCIVNAPAVGDRAQPELAAILRCEQSSFDLLERCGLKVDRASRQTVRTAPMDFHRLFPATGGALYGMASHGWRASFRRPGARSRVPGLYLAGGSTHPGAGVPMAALSGRQAAASVQADLFADRRRSRA